jgi:hypothetical protein
LTDESSRARVLEELAKGVPRQEQVPIASSLPDERNLASFMKQKNLCESEA